MRVLIITGGSLCESAAKQIERFAPEWVIAADYGIHHALKLGVHMNMILGDFDSIDPKELAMCGSVERLTFPPEKDYTDTELALEAALEKAGDTGEILIVGAMGTRADHSLANILLLKRASDVGIVCTIVDDYNRIRLIRGPVVCTVKAGSSYISLLPVFGDAEGVTLTGFYYPLTDAVIPCGRAWGVSNELVETSGSIRLEKGYLLVVEASDPAHRDSI